MSASSTLLWLVCCLLLVIGLVAVVVAVVVRRSRGYRVAAVPTPVLPDFAVIDCGEQIHFVPLPEDDHVLGAGRCPCQPRRTANRRIMPGRDRDPPRARPLPQWARSHP